jgi:hypothetical protein
MDEYRLYAIALAGLISGAILGASIPTNTERKIRVSGAGWHLFSNASLTGVVLNQLLQLAVLGALVAGVLIGILRTASAYPLGQIDRYLLVGCLFSAAAIAKWVRYRYWKSKSPPWR